MRISILGSMINLGENRKRDTKTFTWSVVLELHFSCSLRTDFLWSVTAFTFFESERTNRIHYFLLKLLPMVFGLLCSLLCFLRLDLPRKSFCSGALSGERMWGVLNGT